MSDPVHVQFGEPADHTAAEHERRARQWAMFLHLSALAGYVVLGAGFVAPVLIWQLKKEEFPELDVHGRIVVNWLISYVIYLTFSVILITIFIGIPLVMLIGALGIVFPIIGAIKANNGEAWKYPLSLSLL